MVGMYWKTGSHCESRSTNRTRRRSSVCINMGSAVDVKIDDLGFVQVHSRLNRVATLS